MLFLMVFPSVLLITLTGCSAFETAYYWVIFDGNGYTDGKLPQPQLVRNKDSVSIPNSADSFSREDYSFTGWSFSKEGGELIPADSYHNTIEFKIEKKSLVIYAQWEKNIPRGIVYKTTESESGSAPIDTSLYTQGQEFTILGNSGNLVRWGFDFAGWKTDPQGSEAEYVPGSTYEMGDYHIMLHPHWVKQGQCAITYHDNYAQYGEPPAEGGEYYPGDSYTVLGNTWNLYREGYSFGGWRTPSYSSGSIYNADDEITLDSSRLDFYPVWIAD